MKTRTVFGMKKQPALWPFQRVGFCDFFELRWCLGVQGQFLGGGRVMGGGGSNSLSDILEKKGEREERELSLQLVSTLGGGGREED